MLFKEPKPGHSIACHCPESTMKCHGPKEVRKVDLLDEFWSLLFVLIVDGGYLCALQIWSLYTFARRVLKKIPVKLPRIQFSTYDQRIIISWRGWLFSVAWYEPDQRMWTFGKMSQIERLIPMYREEKNRGVDITILVLCALGAIVCVVVYVGAIYLKYRGGN